MVTLSDSTVSSSARPLPIRRRPDLTARRQRFQGRTYWVVKDPVGLNYFYFQEEEYAVLQMLDGQTSLDQIQQRFEARFPPQKITLEEIQQFPGMLHQSSLVIAAVSGQGQQLLKRRLQRRRKELLGAVSNVLCIRFKGFDPERVLNWLYPRVRWFFSPVAVVLCVMLALAALALVTVQFDVFRSKLPDFYEFFSVRNAFLLAVVLAVTKILHEFGHGLACKHFGGECHEMGIMILVLTPCLYCNVSDSWLLPNKWHRAAIGAAGMYVEVVLASIATFLWWFTEPGLLNHLCLNVMFIASVSTILFNGNPLLRYDGYFILADILEIPNLRQKATRILSRKMGQWLLGIEPPDDPDLPQRKQGLFALYTVAAVLYRWFILFSILFFLYKVFEPAGLKIVGQAIILVSLVGLVGMPLYQLGRFFYVPGRIEQVKKPRICASLTVLALVVLGVLFIRLPHHVVCTLEIQPREAAAVYVHVAGTLESVEVKPGDRVSCGQPLARLGNADVDLRLARMVRARDRYLVRLKNLQWQQHRDPQAAAAIRHTEEALRTLEEQLQKAKQDQDRLRLTAPADGAVLPPPWVAPRDDPDGRLPGWSGTPLEPENQGCLLQQGTLFCQIGDPRRMEAILVIDQADIELVREGQEVEILLDQLPGEPLSHNTVDGEPVNLAITEIAKSDLAISPKRLSTKSGGELPTRTDPAGVERPMSTSYQARVPLGDPDRLLRAGLRGTAKVRVESNSLGARLWRLILQTVNFRL